MKSSRSESEGMNCFKCGNSARNIHLCKIAGVSQIICDNCCKELLKEKKCHHRECGHYRII